MRRLAVVLLIIILGLLSFYSYQKHLRQRKEATATQAPLQRNVYMITASGLRADHLSSYMYQPIQTPAIDFLAYDGVRFTNAYTPSTESLTAHLSILTGIYPFHEPLKKTTEYLLDLGERSLPKDLLTLPDILTSKGYRTAAFLADPELRFPAFFGGVFHQSYTGDEILYPWQTAYSTPTACKLAREWIRNNRAIPHFLLLNFHEPTFPFEPPAPYNRQYAKYPYDGEIAGVDEQVGLFVDLLKELGLFQRSIIVLTAPYGETLGDQSRYAYPNNPVLHVPLLITAPGLLPRHENYDAQVSLIDLVPTILELLELTIDAPKDGLPLFGEDKQQISREFVLGTMPFARLLGFPAEYFVRTGEFLYVNGAEEKVIPHHSVPVSEAGIAEKIKKGREILKKEGISSVSRSETEVETEPTLLLEKVIELARQKRPEIGLDLLQVFAEQLPQSAYKETLAGMLSSACGDQEGALVALRKAVQLAPTPRPNPFLARSALAAGHPEEAWEAMKRYKRAAPYLSYDVRSTYGIALYQLNRNEEALLEFHTVLRQNPRYSEAYLYRGKIWKKLGRFAEAEKDWKMAIEVSWNHVAAYRELASLFETHGQPADALPYLRQLLRFEPQNYEAMLQLAMLHQKAGNQAEARKLSQQVILYSDSEELKSRAKQIISSF
ncbi:sulfatase-like hydrolase/transferase [bacterium]|nr:sulfatase-like hydrolase/transferase [bacterium]